MNILITNDDGIYAAGMIPLVEWCAKRGHVTVAAPLVEQSAKSHSIQIHDPFTVEKVDLMPGVEAYAVDSYPADCIRFAVLGLDRRYDLVISGINRGYNMGHDIMYSGTAAAACEAVHLGMRALAISTDRNTYPKAVEQLDRIFAFLEEHKLLEQHPFYNINIPPTPGPIRITRQGGPYFCDSYSNPAPGLYQAHGYCIHEDRGDLTLDTDATIAGCVSICPLQIDRTQMEVYRNLAGLSEI